MSDDFKGHTPGPWFVYEDCSRVGAEGAKTVETGIAGKYLTESLFDRTGNLYNPHDARLIAAAPDMADELTRLRAEVEALRLALRKTVDMAEYWINRENRRGMSESDFKTWHALGYGSNAMKAARAALKETKP